jgi:hypothetical protein
MTLLLVQTNVLFLTCESYDPVSSEDHRAMTESSIVFEENIAPEAAALQARGLADWLRTCVGLAVPAGSAASSGSSSRQHLQEEQPRSPLRGKVRGPEDDVRQHFWGAVKDIMGQGPRGTDFVLCAVGRMAEDILRISESAEQDSQFAAEWVEYARWVLPRFDGTARNSI